MQHRICPECNSTLDYGERRDCQKEEAALPLPREKPLITKSIFSVSAPLRKVKGRGT